MIPISDYLVKNHINSLKIDMEVVRYFVNLG